MGIINCEKIALHYGTKEILNDITLNINHGSKVGVIGVNGAGKSSLLNIIAGKCPAVRGNVRISPSAKIGIHSQHSDNVSDVYGVMLNALIYANVLLPSEKAALRAKEDLSDVCFSLLTDEFKAAGDYNLYSKAHSFVKKLGFDDSVFNTPICTLSGGEKTKLALASLLLTNDDIFLLDEPTNHLDNTSAEWLEDYILSSKKTFLIVSHDRYFLDRTTDSTIEIENTHAVMYDGSYSVFREKKKKLTETQNKHYELQQHEIKRLEDYIALQRRWNRERNIKAAESREKAIERIKKIERIQSAPKAIRFKIAASKAYGTDVLYVKNLSKRFGEKLIFTCMTFDVKRHDRLFIIGPNGSGKSTLMKILTGRELPSSGEFYFGYNQKIGYYDQEQQQLDEANSVISEIWDICPDRTQTQIRTYLASFGFVGDDIFKQISLLSGGERARLTIAKLVLEEVSVLILDEPTNHLDIPSREVLEDALSSYDGTVICVSHDRYFIKKIANRLLAFDGIGTSNFSVFNGTYEEYIERKKATDSETSFEKTKEPDTSNEYFTAKKERSDKKKKESLILRTEKEIIELEHKLEYFSSEINSNASDYVKLLELYRHKQNAEERLEELYEILLENSQ